MEDHREVREAKAVDSEGRAAKEGAMAMVETTTAVAKTVEVSTWMPLVEAKKQGTKEASGMPSSLMASAVGWLVVARLAPAAESLAAQKVVAVEVAPTHAYRHRIDSTPMLPPHMASANGTSYIVVSSLKIRRTSSQP